MGFLEGSISRQIWDVKYRYRLDGKVIDHTLEDTWLRVAKAIARIEPLKNRPFWQQEFYDLLDGFRFLPGGRILAGAGTKHHVTLFNCFVMHIAEDSMTGIFNALKEGALTLQQGGGVGYDFSVLRPQGDVAKKTGIAASGPVSFMRIWDTMCSVLLSTGARRGAMMAVLRCDHPDIERFITAKADATQLRHFNVSVLVSDAFMQAVKQDAEWELVFPVSAEDSALGERVERRWPGYAIPVTCRVYRRVKARALWEQITRSAYDYAEPGVLFEDTINRMNNLWYREWIGATNPCGEIPLPSYGACNLGALNLTQFVTNPFASNARLDWQGIEKASAVATRFLDNVIDVSRYPLKAQREEALATRRIGLGFTGLADVFVMLGLKYGAPESLRLARRIMETIAHVTWRTSAELAAEKGSFPVFKQQEYLQGQFVKTLPRDLQDKIASLGMRNSHHNTIAPTGTISILANNVSSGIEPIFGDTFERYILKANGEREKFRVRDYALQCWRAMTPGDALPPGWVDSQLLSPADHLNMQRVVQPYIDNAISKTINLPENFPFEQLSAVYTEAYEFGLKGCTIFRPNPTTGSVLVVADPDEDVERCCQV
jgi:ribonucleoside-diphosphate reductase alpha chain